MRKLPLIYLLIIAFSSLGALHTNAADLSPLELLQRHISIRGGRSALDELRFIERFGQFRSPAAGLSGSYHTCINYPEAVAISIDAGPLQMHQVLHNGRALVCENGFTACQTAPEEIRLQLTETARIANREELEDTPPSGESVEWLDLGGGKVGFAYFKDGEPRELGFDRESGLMSHKSIGEQTREYSDWRQTGPIMLPMVYEHYQDGKHSTSIHLEWAQVMDQASPWCNLAFGLKSLQEDP